MFKEKTKLKINLKKSLENNFLDSDNFNFYLTINSFTNCFGNLIKKFFFSNLLGGLISFYGGYLICKCNIFIGLIFIVLALVFVSVINSYETKFDLFSESIFTEESKLKNICKIPEIINEKKKDIYKVSQMNFGKKSNEKLNENKLWLTIEDFSNLHFKLAWYLCEADIESANWLNCIINIFWAQMQNYLSNLAIKYFYNLVLIFSETNKLINFKLKNFSLGKNSPYISGIRIIKTGIKREDLVMDFEFTFDSDLKIKIEGDYLLEAEIVKLFVKGKFRILASPLFREIPAVGSMVISLIDFPEINWVFNGFLSFLNFSLIKKIFIHMIFFWFGYPCKIKLNIAKFVLPLRELKLLEPIFLIKVDIIEAINLPHSKLNLFFSNKKTNAYCLVSIKNIQKFTSVKHNCDNPEWNQTLIFFLYNKKADDKIEIYIYDEYLDNEDRLIGKVEILINAYRKHNYLLNAREFDSCIWNENDKTAIKSGLTRIVFRISCFELSNDICKLDSTLKISKNLLPVAVLTVLIDSVSGLETVAHQVQTPELRTMVRVCVGNQTEITSIKERTGYPVWEEELNFLLYNPTFEDVYVEVIDMYWVTEKKNVLFVNTNLKSKNILDRHLLELSKDGIVLGYVTIRIIDILTNFQMKKEGTFQLEGYSEEAYIRILLTIRITECLEYMYKNQNLKKSTFPNINLQNYSMN